MSRRIVGRAACLSAGASSPSFDPGSIAAVSPTYAVEPAAPPVTPAFLPLPPGAVEPQGWLRDWAVAMRDGMTGHLDECDPVFQLGWLGKRIGTTGESAPGEGWPLEQAAYWIDGAVRLGHVLLDHALLAKVSPRLEKIAGAENRNGSSLWWREKFPMLPRVIKGRETGGSPYACVYAGPLLFTRGIPEKKKLHRVLRHDRIFASIKL